MEKVKFVDFEMSNGQIETFAIIEREDGSFSSMSKKVYEITMAEQSGTL